MWRPIWPALVFGVMLGWLSPARAFVILDPGSTVAGRTIADWSAAWWTWILNAPAAQNPLLDPSGAFANVDNNRPVFFLASTSGLEGGPVTRNFSAPADKPILVPVLTFADIEAASVDPGASFADRSAAANTVIAAWPAHVTSLSASVDGVPIPNLFSHLEETGLFSAGPTQAGSFAAQLGVAVGDDLSPTKAAGFWLMIEDLGVGQHTISLSGTSNSFSPPQNCCTALVSAFDSSLTDNISVPEPATALLLLPALIGLGLLRERQL
jgi:hypothetical protein